MAQRIRYYTQGEDERELPQVPAPEAPALPQTPAAAQTPAAPQVPTTPQPPSYDDSARQQQRQAYSAWSSRGPFQYDPSKDPMYSIYRDRYVQNARLGMRDTMAQAAALTGGYGSSYAQGVGQQRYDETMRGLTDKIPELYEAAYARYQDEGDRLLRQYSLLGEQADRDYSQYRDALGDFQTERAWQAQQDETAYGRSQDAYSRLYALMANTGYQPTQEDLEAAGMTQEQADAVWKEFYRANGIPIPGTAPATPQVIYVPQGGGGKPLTAAEVSKIAYEIGSARPNEAQEIYNRYLNSGAFDGLDQASQAKIIEAVQHASQTGKYASRKP